MASDNTTFIIVLGLIILVILYYLLSSDPIHNEGELQTRKNNSETLDDASDEQTSDQSDNSDIEVESSESIDTIRERAQGMNGPYYRGRHGGYRHSSYKDLGGENSYNEVDKHFKIDDITKRHVDDYVPIDESGDVGAPINISNNKGTEKDKYDVDGYLPKEKEKNWFETVDTVDVKNKHLINIYRPIGANTIGSSHKVSVYDIRGNDGAICPKMVVSPWNQSSVEPDVSSKSLCA